MEAAQDNNGVKSYPETHCYKVTDEFLNSIVARVLQILTVQPNTRDQSRGKKHVTFNDEVYVQEIPGRSTDDKYCGLVEGTDVEELIKECE